MRYSMEGKSPLASEEYAAVALVDMRTAFWARTTRSGAALPAKRADLAATGRAAVIIMLMEARAAILERNV